jgi:hypothetical protein
MLFIAKYCTMPRLSLYKPEKGNDYKFLDRNISEMFQVGGTDLYLHKYLGPKNPLAGESTADQPTYNVVKETNIQDLLFLENRDRKYDMSVYTLRGIYNVQDIDFNLSQFGLFIDQDTVFMTVHINDFVSTIGRKPLAGDVIELPHLKDEFALNDFDVALPRYFVIDEVGRAAEGFSKTWYPHLYRLKLKKISDSQQFADILTKPINTDANFVGDYDPTVIYTPGQIVRYQGTLYTTTVTTTAGILPTNASYFGLYGGHNLQDILSTNAKNLAINDAILAQADADAPKSGYETQQFYTLAVDDNGNPALITADDSVSPPDASTTSLDASRTAQRPKRTGYSGYLLGDGIPVNGADFGSGIAFPAAAIEGDYYLRVDMFPNRLFRYDGKRWIKVEDAVRHTLSNSDTRQTFRTGFINNSTFTYTALVASDTVTISQLEIDNGFSVIDTAILFAGNSTSKYLVINQSVIKLDFDIAEYPGIITSYVAQVNGINTNLIRITLPEGSDITIPGQWIVSLFNTREAQKQSLSKALRPKADF